MPRVVIAPHRLGLGLLFAALAAAPALAADVRTLCKGETQTAAGSAWAKSRVLNGVPGSTTAEFMPMFHSTIAAVAPARIPDIAKDGGTEPNTGAFPAAKFYYEYKTRADGKHDLPAYRLTLEVPVYAGGESKAVFFKVSLGDWQGGKRVTKTDISAIVGLPDVPIYGVDLQIQPFEGQPADADAAALEAILRSADHADIEIHEGSADGPLKVKGTIMLAGGRDRLVAVGGALSALGAQFNAGTCQADN